MGVEHDFPFFGVVLPEQALARFLLSVDENVLHVAVATRNGPAMFLQIGPSLNLRGPRFQREMVATHLDERSDHLVVHDVPLDVDR